MVTKKGVSPLIATVLLLAFAVSIATIIVQLEPFTGGCSVYAADVVEVGGNKRVCYNTNVSEIEITVRNGRHDIVESRVSIIGERDSVNEENHNFIGSNTVDKINVSYNLDRYGQPEKIILVPSYDRGGDLTECDTEFTLSGVMPCE